jgi:hypothetical protein
MVSEERIVVFGCESIFEWELEVPSSRNPKDIWVVRWSKEHKESEKFKFGYSCSCPAYKYRPGECKHIKRVRRENRRCGWSQEIDGGEPERVEEDGGLERLYCPGCGGPVRSYEISV